MSQGLIERKMISTLTACTEVTHTPAVDIKHLDKDNLSVRVRS